MPITPALKRLRQEVNGNLGYIGDPASKDKFMLVVLAVPVDYTSTVCARVRVCVRVHVCACSEV
jgi:hypothetical protein